MISNTVTCDVCGVVKKEANKWFVVAANLEYVGVNHAENRSCIPGSFTTKDACGEKCTLRLVARWMRTGSLEEVVEAKA